MFKQDKKEKVVTQPPNPTDPARKSEGSEMPELLPCPFCGSKPVKSLTKKQGCQMHGEPMQYAVLECTKCEFKPRCQGGDIYNGGKAEAYASAAAKWNTRAQPDQPSDESQARALEVAKLHVGIYPRYAEEKDAQKPAAAVDLEALKRKIYRHHLGYEPDNFQLGQGEDFSWGYQYGGQSAVDEAIDYLAAQGWLVQPRGGDND